MLRLVVDAAAARLRVVLPAGQIEQVPSGVKAQGVGLVVLRYVHSRPAAGKLPDVSVLYPAVNKVKELRAVSLTVGEPVFGLQTGWTLVLPRSTDTIPKIPHTGRVGK